MDEYMKHYKVGYTQGVYDMFHIGHLNLLNHAKERCDYLIVGVNSDDLVASYKNKRPMINEENRRLIVQNIKAIDKAIVVTTLNKEKILEQIHFDAIFIGDDWKGSPRWKETEHRLNKHNVEVVYLPYTDGISSTLLGESIEKRLSKI